ncbi:MAG: DUF4838 domain-containing protein [Ruminococcaceae bacterium]|nr:DUF4838 domain-containing protein [Oscillospiraceae bacterium]
MRKLTVCGCDIAEYTIVLKPIPDPAEKTAAEFLVRVIETACGVKLPVSDTAEHGICIGTREKSDEVKWDGFRMTTDDKNLYLDGNIPRGTLYAAYDFAEKYLGWRLFAPDCEVVSTEETAEVPVNLNIIDNPTFEERRCDCRVFEHNMDYYNKSRLNTQPIATPNRLGEEVGGAVDSPWDCHSFGRLLPGGEYFKEHPEYYALVNGERIPCNDGGGPGQPCLTNSDVLRIVTENVLNQLRENPALPFVEVSHCDNHNYCRCEKCAAVDEEEGSHSGTMIRFVNAVAEAVEKEFPNVLVRTFAYEYTREPPKVTKARHNVLIRYCTYDACFRHGLDDPHCEVNSTTTWREMAGWQKMCSQMSIWDYISNWDCFIAPFPNLVSIRENARCFAECHAIHVFGEGAASNNASGVYPDLRAYLYAKVMWNAYMSEEEYRRHINEFLAAYYGKGWEHIRRYMDMEYEITAKRCFTCKESVDIAFIHCVTYPPVPTFKQLMRRNYVAQPYQPMYPDHVLVGLVQRMDEAQECFDRALRMAETESERFHIERSRMAIDYVDLFCSERNEFAMTPEERAAYMARVEKFYRDKEKYGFHYNNHTSVRGR